MAEEAITRTNGQAAEQPNDDDAGEEDAIQTELRSLHLDVHEHRQRFTNMQHEAMQSGDTQRAQLYGELAGTVMHVIQDVIAAVGAGFEDMDGRLADVESDTPASSYLTEEDALEYMAAFEQIKRLLAELTNGLPDGSEGDSQREIFGTLGRLIDDRIEYTRQIGDLPDAPPVPDASAQSSDTE